MINGRIIYRCRCRLVSFKALCPQLQIILFIFRDKVAYWRRAESIGAVRNTALAPRRRDRSLCLANLLHRLILSCPYTVTYAWTYVFRKSGLIVTQKNNPMQPPSHTSA